MNISGRTYGPGFNWRVVVPTVGLVVGVLGVAMLVCALHALAADDGTADAFAISGGILVLAAGVGVLVGRRLRRLPIRTRDTFLAVTLAWLLGAAAGTLPFLIHGTLPRFADALFESMSGLTTTGATVLEDVDAQPDTVLLWRSLTAWLGGAGIVVLVVAVAPAIGVAAHRVFHTDSSSGPVGRLAPRVAEIAKVLLSVYVGLTLAGVAAFALAGMDAFDAVNHAMSAVSTGGFSTHATSIAWFDSVAVEVIAIVLMAAASLNYAFYWRVVRGRSVWPQAAEVRAFLLIALAAIGAVAASLALADEALAGGELRGAAFSVVSVLSTTGFVTSDYDTWNDFARGLLVLLMLVGGCVGSAAGGIKVARVQVLTRSAVQELHRQLQPRAVLVLRSGRTVLPEDARRSTYGFFVLFVGVAALGTFAMLASGMEITSATTGVVAALTVTGPGLGAVGPGDTFGTVSEGGQIVLSVLMLVGRLEVFTVLVLLTPAFWRRSVA